MFAEEVYLYNKLRSATGPAGVSTINFYFMATKKTNGGDAQKKKEHIWTIRVNEDEHAKLLAIMAATGQTKQFVLENAVLNGMKTVKEEMAKNLKQKAADLLNQASALERVSPSVESQQRKKP